MQITDFGKMGTDAAVQAVTISAGDLTATILTLGCTLQSVRLSGVSHSLTLGSETLTDYAETMRYFGAIVGPVANRIAGAQTKLNGRTLSFPANENGNLLHSGDTGAHTKLWTITATSANSVTMTLALPDGMGGFPGNRQITANFQIDAPAILRLAITATTDTDTLMNFANHSYWNLDGSAQWPGHSLQIAADHTLPTDAALLPTGIIAPVADTDFDFRKSRAWPPGTPPLDTNFCLSNDKTALRPVATLTGTSGLSMTLATTEPGLQIYDAQRTARPGRAKYEGIAIEAQGWPDAPNHANFPRINATPDAPYTQITEWRFTQT